MAIRLLCGRTKHYIPKVMICKFYTQIWIRVDLPKLYLTIMLGVYEK